MARRTELKPHLTPEQLKQRYRTAKDRAECAHFQTLWLISQGHTQAQTAQIVGYSERWVNTLVKRYNSEKDGGPEAMRDRRHEHTGSARVLDEEGHQELSAAFRARPADGGVWTSRKTAAFMSDRLGRKVSISSGWRTLRRLGQTPQRPRPRHKNSDPNAQEEFQAAPAEAGRRSRSAAPGSGGGALGDG